jgi:hypothetical protein
MNPRLTSMVLTGIPTRSTGPVISAITRFLDLASDQQRAVNESMLLNTQRGLVVLRGLRHIRLELRPEQSEEGVNFDSILDLVSAPPGRMRPGSWSKDFEALNSASLKFDTNFRSDFQHDPKQEYTTHRVEAFESSTGNMFTIPVWVGSNTSGPHPAVNEYMANLRDPRLRKNVGPAMPNHIAAGVPSGSYIYYAAWNAIIFTTSLSDVDENSTLHSMIDVAAAIKEYRMKTKGTRRHWTGRLELVTIHHNM